MQQREPSSIFSDISMDVGTEEFGQDEVMDIQDDDNLAGLKFDEDIDNQNIKIVDLSEDGDEDDEDSTHPSILPPKHGFGNNYNKKRKRREMNGDGNLNDSIKNLVDNITSNKGTLSKQESRFANLYKDIHSGKKEEQRQSQTGENDQDNDEVASQFSNLIDTMKSNGRVNGNNSGNKFVDPSRETKKNGDDVNSWKSFTNDLMSSSQGNDLKNRSSVLIEKDEQDDDLLTDLFGNQHKPDSVSNKTTPQKPTSARASALMDAIPELIQDLNDDDNENDNDNTDDDNEEDKWTWQQVES